MGHFSVLEVAYQLGCSRGYENRGEILIQPDVYCFHVVIYRCLWKFTIYLSGYGSLVDGNQARRTHLVYPLFHLLLVRRHTSRGRVVTQ